MSREKKWWLVLDSVAALTVPVLFLIMNRFAFQFSWEVSGRMVIPETAIFFIAIGIVAGKLYVDHLGVEQEELIAESVKRSFLSNVKDGSCVVYLGDKSGKRIAYLVPSSLIALESSEVGGVREIRFKGLASVDYGTIKEVRCVETEEEAANNAAEGV